MKVKSVTTYDICMAVIIGILCGIALIEVYCLVWLWFLGG
jgi:hypothetical protein